MKYFLITGFSLFFILMASGLFAQISAPTTDEEYNYGAIGYKIQLQAKLGNKQGYNLTDAEGCEEPERKIEYKIMYRSGETTPCGVILIYTRMRNPPQYYC